MDVNIASFTFSSTRQIDPQDVPRLKILALVGKAFAKDQQEAWADRVCLRNSHGPSEFSVITNIHKGVTKSSDTANIGPIIAGSGWIVDRDDYDKLLPLGAPGEILIEGSLLGRGYLIDPRKTAAAFIENSRWASQSAGRTRRFYRYGADGSLVLEGRKGTQVKIREQRVEIGEVEHQLGKLYPNVRCSSSVLEEGRNVRAHCDGLAVRYRARVQSNKEESKGIEKRGLLRCYQPTYQP